MHRVSAIILLTAILAMEAFVARAISGSGLHQALLLVAMTGAVTLRWAGGAVARWGALLLAVGMAWGGWWLARSGVVPVTLSEPPLAFSIAMALHLWVWTRLFTAAIRSDAPGAGAMGILCVIASGMVIWCLEQVEIYGRSVFQPRALAVAGWVGSVFLFSLWHTVVGRRGVAEGVTVVTGKTSSRISRLPSLISVIAVVLFAAWTLTWTERAALAAYGWWGREGDATDLGAFGQDRPQIAEGTAAPDGAMRQLPRRADLSLDNTLRFHLWFDEEAGFQKALHTALYLRTSTMGLFSADGGMGPVRLGAWIYDSDDGREDGNTALGALPDDRDPLTAWALIGRGESNGLPLWPITGGVGLSGVYAFADDWYQLALDTHQDRVRYHTIGTQTHWSDLAGNVGDLQKGEALSEYLQLPASALTRRILATAREAAPSEWALKDRIEGIRGYLAKSCAYSLSYENPDDLDPIENFLFQERRGHCELYAAGTVMLLRAIGVPARVALGFSGGEAEPSRRLIAFRQSDFHAWAEIFLADHGWVIFDTTPDGPGAARPPDLSDSPRLFPSVDPGLYEDLGGERLMGKVSIPLWYRAFASVTGWVSRWFGVFCVAGALVAFAYYLLGRRRSRNSREEIWNGPRPDHHTWGAETEDGLRELMDAYLAACASRGWVKGAGQTLREFLADLKRVGVCGGECDDLVAYCYRIRYAREARDPRLEAGFLKIIESMAEADSPPTRADDDYP